VGHGTVTSDPNNISRTHQICFLDMQPRSSPAYAQIQILKARHSEFNCCDLHPFCSRYYVQNFVSCSHSVQVIFRVPAKIAGGDDKWRITAPMVKRPHLLVIYRLKEVSAPRTQGRLPMVDQIENFHHSNRSVANASSCRHL
jgi:hypothetical protein